MPRLPKLDPLILFLSCLQDSTNYPSSQLPSKIFIHDEHKEKETFVPLLFVSFVDK